MLNCGHDNDHGCSVRIREILTIFFMKRGFYNILAAQFLSSLADNALLIAAIALLASIQAPDWMTPLLKLFFVLSYVGLAAWVGIFADLMPKGRVMFITTANTTDTIPRALLDRMEVIELGSYTDEEKLQIAKRHLLPKQLKKHGMKRTQVRVSDDAIREIIACYTRESGFRSLQRQIAALCRKCAMRFVSDEPPKRISITGGNLEDFLGVRKFLPEANVTTDQVGLVTGLAWTAVGGTTLEVEVNVVDGTGKLELTGNLGDVMKESAFAAMSFIRSRAKALGLAPDFYKTKDIHVHFPEGAVPKDGPSAGITICTAIVSALTNRPVRRDVAMTGEISIRGRVLAIGGLKEKTMAALRHGVKTVIIPAENEKDLEEIDQTVRQALQFITVSSADRVLEAALLPADDAAGTISVPAAPAMPIPAPKTRRKPGIRQ